MKKSVWITLLVISILIVVIGIIGYPFIGRFIGILAGFEIVKIEGYDTFKGLNYVFIVKCGVEDTRNVGGNVNVVATFEGQGKYWKQTQQVHLEKGGYEEVEFVFDISFWRGLFQHSNFRYNCNIG